MFIIEGRTAGVVAALIIAAGPALVSSFSVGIDRDSPPPTASMVDTAFARRAAASTSGIVPSTPASIMAAVPGAGGWRARRLRAD